MATVTPFCQITRRRRGKKTTAREGAGRQIGIDVVMRMVGLWPGLRSVQDRVLQIPRLRNGEPRYVIDVAE
jgi:hypothetical protein